MLLYSDVVLHGTFGYWDEAILIALGVVLVTALVLVWLMSRTFEPEYDEAAELEEVDQSGRG